MQQITVGTKYQIVIPKEIREKIKVLRPGTKVNVYQSSKNTISIDLTPKDWVERNYGLMSEAWKDMDPIAELEKGRDEWEERLKLLRRYWNALKKRSRL